MSQETPDVAEEVAGLIARARIAQHAIEEYSQDDADRLVTAVAWAVARQDRAEELARLAVEEGGFGGTHGGSGSRAAFGRHV